MTAKLPNELPISVIVPARNEAATIARVIETMSDMPLVDEVVVVDNGSTDGTAAVAEAAGGRVVTEARPGMGHAIRAGFIAARNDWVMKVDADLDRFDTSLFGRLTAARAPGVGLIKGQWQDPRDAMPMTRYLVMPALRQMFPALGGLKAPNSGIYAFDRALIALPEIIGDYAADIDVMLRVHAAGAEVTEVDIGRLDNNPRDAGHYSAMSDTIMAFFLRQREFRITEEIVVLAETAAQVATGCLGTIASHARAGGRVRILLADADTSVVDALRAALQDYPTVQVGLLADAASFRRGSTVSGRRLIAPQGAMEVEHALHPMLGSLAEHNTATVLLMLDADADQRASVNQGYDISAGLQIKADLLQKLGLPSRDLPSREGFHVTHL